MDTHGSSAAPLRALIAQLPELIAYVGADLRFEIVNERYGHFFGLTPDQIEGRPVREIVGEELYLRVEPFYRRVLQGETLHYNNRVRTVLGTSAMLEVHQIPVQLPGEPVRGFFLVIYDEEVSGQTEQLLRSTTLRWQSLVESNPDSVLLSQRDSTLLYLNRFPPGRGPEDVLGRQALDFVEPALRDTYRAHFERVWDTQRTIDFEAEVRVDSQKLWCMCRLAPVVRDGQTECLLGVVRDITAQKRAAEETAAIQRRLQEKQRLESLGVLAAGIAHDFNNLLTGILGNANLAEHECAADTPLREYLHQIEKATLRAADLCKQMLAYAGKDRFVFRPTDLNTFLAEQRAFFEQATSGKASFVHDLAEAVPAVRADEAQLRRALLELVTNALEAAEESRQPITLRTGSSVVDAAFVTAHALDREAPAGLYATIAVNDAGHGIPEHLLSRIFEPFYSTKFVGRGLGLAAVQGIVRCHQGLITVSSSPAEGTCFTLYLPSITPVSADALSPG